MGLQVVPEEGHAGTDTAEQDGPVPRLLLTTVKPSVGPRANMKDTGESKDHQLTVSSHYILFILLLLLLFLMFLFNCLSSYS